MDSSPLIPKIDAGGRHFWRVMVVKITCLEGNGRLNYKFNSSKNRYQSGILLYCAGTDGITCGRKLRVGMSESKIFPLKKPACS